MRVHELADLTGTTVRTVRYYHQIGLLPVPETQNGHRDYGLAHLARVTRIRWLTQSGVSLSRIASILGATAASADTTQDTRRTVLADLEATDVALSEHEEQLRRQRDRVRRLIAAVQDEDRLSPLPAVVARFYDELERRAEGEDVRRSIRQERDFMELAYYRGEMPPEAASVFEGLGEAGLGESLSVFGVIAARETPADADVAELVSQVVARLRRRLGDDLPRVARRIDPGLARRAADLYCRLSEARTRSLDRAIADAVLALLEEARS